MYNNSKERGFILDKDAKRFVLVKMQYYQFGKVPSKCSCLSSLFNSVVDLQKHYSKNRFSTNTSSWLFLDFQRIIYLECLRTAASLMLQGAGKIISHYLHNIKATYTLIPRKSIPNLYSYFRLTLINLKNI